METERECVYLTDILAAPCIDETVFLLFGTVRAVPHISVLCVRWIFTVFVDHTGFGLANSVNTGNIIPHVHI